MKHEITKFETLYGEVPKELPLFDFRAELQPDGSVKTRMHTDNMTAFREVKLIGFATHALAAEALMAMDKLDEVILVAPRPEAQAAAIMLGELRELLVTIKESSTVIAESFTTLGRLPI